MPAFMHYCHAHEMHVGEPSPCHLQSYKGSGSSDLQPQPNHLATLPLHAGHCSENQLFSGAYTCIWTVEHHLMGIDESRAGLCWTPANGTFLTRATRKSIDMS